MKTLERNASNDIFLDATGQFQMCDGKLCKAQILEAAILTITGELQLDTEQGIPYFSTVFQNSYKIDTWAKFVKKRVMRFQWVKRIESFEYSFDHSNNALVYSMEVLVDEGNVIIGNTTFNTSITIPNSSGGDGDMESLIDNNGHFYLPVFKIDGIQYFRKMETVEDEYGTTIKLSESLYIKDKNGVFIVS